MSHLVIKRVAVLGAGVMGAQIDPGTRQTALRAAPALPITRRREPA
ncbi:MAG TPA: hypothetical protein VGK73_13595 [Polyangiaceae bacterium]